MKAICITLNGIVQGVGFRPFIYRLAIENQWKGTVQNTPLGVNLVLNSDHVNLDLVQEQILSNLPPLARIDQLSVKGIKVTQKFNDFKILESLAGNTSTEVLEDVCICHDCINELFDSQSHYYLYPFISCTNCGPRYSVINQLPYDRHLTAFKDFNLCTNCHRAYTDSNNRRYHAQTTVCSSCGPSLSVEYETIINTIKSGQIIALKSNSAFHLIIDALNEKSIETLRVRKHRPNKPFALMALNAESVKQWMHLSDKEESILTSNSAPIVLLKQKENDQLSSLLNPGLDSLGVMLPSTGLHYLLFYYLLGKPKDNQWLDKACNILLVVTSANLSGDAVICDNNRASEQLNTMADLVVTHNREVSMRCDDSVVKTDSKHRQMIRRAKGYAPRSIKLDEKLPKVLALGSYLKNTLCFVKGHQAYISQYIGDLDSQDTLFYYQEVLSHFKKFYSTDFDLIATELHPDFYPNELVSSMSIPIIPIQHHRAHLASVIAEHNLKGCLLGVVLDGYGYGDDEQAWGGELFLCNTDQAQFRRCGSLLPMTYFSGDRVQKEPWRMAVLLSEQFNLPKLDHLEMIPNTNAFLSLLRNKKNHITTTSCGRLFDAISSLLDVCHYNTYEAEAAMRLESLVKKIRCDQTLFEIDSDNQLNIAQLIDAVVQTKLNHSVEKASELFHGSFAHAVAQWVIQTAQNNHINQIVLNGGCFQNSILLNEVYQQLTKEGFKVYIPKKLPFNDGGLSLGQAYLAAKIYQNRYDDLTKINVNKEYDHVLGDSRTDYSIT